MRHPALIAVLLPIAVAAIALPAWAVLVVKPGTEQLQSLADKACKCERRTDDKACWRALSQRIRQDLNNPGGTLCSPLSTDMVHLSLGDDDYLVLRYRIADGSGLYLCSKEEAVVGEALWYREAGQAFTEEASRIAYPRAYAALRNLALALKRGERLEALKPAMGCVTGYPR